MGASKKTMSAIEIGESLIEAIQICDNDIEKRKYCQKNEQEYVMNARLRVGGCRSVEDYMSERLQVIPTSDLEEVLIIIPFEYLQSFFFLGFLKKKKKKKKKK